MISAAWSTSCPAPPFSSSHFRHSSRSASRCFLAGPMTVSLVLPSFSTRAACATAPSHGRVRSWGSVCRRRPAVAAPRRRGCSRPDPGGRRPPPPSSTCADNVSGTTLVMRSSTRLTNASMGPARSPTWSSHVVPQLLAASMWLTTTRSSGMPPPPWGRAPARSPLGTTALRPPSTSTCGPPTRSAAGSRRPRSGTPSVSSSATSVGAGRAMDRRPRRRTSASTTPKPVSLRHAKSWPGSGAEVVRMMPRIWADVRRGAMASIRAATPQT